MGSGMFEFLFGFRDFFGFRYLFEYIWVSVCGVCECGFGFVFNWFDGGY